MEPKSTLTNQTLGLPTLGTLSKAMSDKKIHVEAGESREQ
jgi:hypothetical protein